MKTRLTRTNPHGTEHTAPLHPRRENTGVNRSGAGTLCLKTGCVWTAMFTLACFALGLCSGCASGAVENAQFGNETEDVQEAGVEEARPIAHRDAAEDILLIIDFQNVYLPGNDWACPSMPEAVKNTVKILESPDAPDYLITRFLSPENPVGRWQQYNEAYQDINKNTYLNELVEELSPYASDTSVISRSTYSAMKAEPTVSALAGKKAVVLAGVTAECSVLATMMDAMDMGYEVVYLYDCVGRQAAELDANIRGLAEIFTPVHTTIMSSDEYLASLRGEQDHI